jgi:hypothetical protein
MFSEAVDAGAFAFERARGGRVGDDEDLVALFQQACRRLHDADVRFHPGEHGLTAAEGPEGGGEAFVLHAGEVDLG